MSAYFVLAVANVVPEIRRHFAALRCVGTAGAGELHEVRSRCEQDFRCIPKQPSFCLTPCRDEGQQGRDIYNSYASGLFVAIALSEVMKHGPAHRLCNACQSFHGFGAGE